MIILADKWKDKFQLYCHVISVFLVPIIIYYLTCHLVPGTNPNGIIDYIIICAPYFSLIYASEMKALVYRRNVGEYILSLVLSSGKKTIDKRYKIFFRKKEFVNRLTGETITFSK